MFTMESNVQTSETNKDGSSDSNNCVGEWPNMINNASNLSNDQMKDIKKTSLYSSTIARVLAPKPYQEEIKRRIQEKYWVTYQHRGKQFQQESQSDPMQQPQGNSTKSSNEKFKCLFHIKCNKGYKCGYQH
jgi:hypothetical protein